MKSYHDLQNETTAIQYDFLLTDLSAASTFLDIAQTTQSSVTRTRNIKNAGKAHDAVQRFLPRTKLTQQQGIELQGKLDLLKLRIESFKLIGFQGAV